MSPEFMLRISHFVIAAALIGGAIGGFGKFHYGSKVKELDAAREVKRINSMSEPSIQVLSNGDDFDVHDSKFTVVLHNRGLCDLVNIKVSILWVLTHGSGDNLLIRSFPSTEGGIRIIPVPMLPSGGAAPLFLRTHGYPGALAALNYVAKASWGAALHIAVKVERASDGVVREFRETLLPTNGFRTFISRKDELTPNPMNDRIDEIAEAIEKMSGRDWVPPEISAGE